MSLPNEEQSVNSTESGDSGYNEQNQQIFRESDVLADPAAEQLNNLSPVKLKSSSPEGALADTKSEEIVHPPTEQLSSIPLEELTHSKSVEAMVPLPANGESIPNEGQLFKVPGYLQGTIFEKKSVARVEPLSPGYVQKYNLEGHNKPITVVKFSPVGDWLASASVDQFLKFWDVDTGKLVKTMEGHALGINDLTWSQNGKYLASCSDDKTIKLWDLRTGDCVKSMIGHTDFVYACSMNPQMNLIASTSFDCNVRLWDIRTGKSLKITPAHIDLISSVDFNRDGSLFVTGSFDGLVRVWDTISGQVQKTLIDEDNTPVGYVKFAPNGRYILAAYLNSQIKLWNFQKPKCLRIYHGHTNLQYCISVNFSVTAGMWIVSGSEDNAIYIWSLQGKELVQKIDGHNREIICTDCHPSLNLFVSGALESTDNLKIWQSSETVLEFSK